MAYQPKPIDTEHVALTDEIREITERLAENAHDRWSQQRLKDGWTYGPQRDDARKKHPGLVPYAELPESEKEYDRIAALQSLKAIIALGYRIERDPSPDPGSNPHTP
jgi:ryanodine receptor 2